MKPQKTDKYKQLILISGDEPMKEKKGYYYRQERRKTTIRDNDTLGLSQTKLWL